MLEVWDLPETTQGMETIRPLIKRKTSNRLSLGRTFTMRTEEGKNNFLQLLKFHCALQKIQRFLQGSIPKIYFTMYNFCQKRYPSKNYILHKKVYLSWCNFGKFKRCMTFVNLQDSFAHMEQLVCLVLQIPAHILVLV